MKFNKAQFAQLEEINKMKGRTIYRKGTRFTTKVKGVIKDILVAEPRFEGDKMKVEYDVELDLWPGKTFRCERKFFDL